MRYLADHKIDLHAQVVLCPTINDGKVLERTIRDLSELHPQLHSVAIVPVVFTGLHNYKDKLTAVTDEFCRSIIKEVSTWQREFRSRFGATFVFLADEFYMRAGISLPGRAHYGNYPQIEDGVGMVRRFMIQTEKILKRDLVSEFGMKRGSLYGTIVTGELFYPILSRAVSDLNNRCRTRLKVAGLRNRFFGEEVTVAGLIAGGDILAARESIEGDFLIVPEQACLKSGHIFLDDLKLEDLEQELGMPVSHGGPSLTTTLATARDLELRSKNVKTFAHSPAVTD